MEWITWNDNIFQASHVTQGLGADSAAFLTEIGFVAVPDLDNATNGYVARGGANENPSNGGQMFRCSWNKLTGLSS